MKKVSLKESSDQVASMDEQEDVMLEPYCRCPLGFHGEFCEKAVDVQVKRLSFQLEPKFLSYTLNNTII